MPASLMSLPHLLRSAFNMTANSSGELGKGSRPAFANLAITSGPLRTRAISLFTLLTTGEGVLAGANMQISSTDSKPGSPDAETVGSPGASADGLGLPTAIALILPDFT